MICVGENGFDRMIGRFGVQAAFFAKEPQDVRLGEVLVVQMITHGERKKYAM